MNKLTISQPYLLAVATWEPRKNLELLVKTFIQLKDEGKLEEYILVLVGGRGWKDKRLASLISGCDSILPLGYVPDDLLPKLYSGADLFLFPSKYEGYGMPVLESLACGTRVVTSDIPELREAGGDEAVYVEPTADGIRQGILKSLETEYDSKNGMNRYPTWSDGAKKMAFTIRTYVGEMKK